MKLRALLLILAAAACTEEAVAPGVCPDFCPGGSIAISDTIFTDIIERDSSFRGYIQPYQAEAMTVADVPGIVDSRAIFLLNATFTRVIAKPGDTATVPIEVDSARLALQIVRRDRNASNLWIRLYRLPLTIDSTSTFTQLEPDFNGPVVDSVNIDSLLARPLITDTQTVRIWGDTIQRDFDGHVLRVLDDSSLVLFFGLDTIQAPFVVADSGRLAWGVRVRADSLGSILLGANDVFDRDPQIRWFYHYTIPDTLPAPDSVAFKDVSREATFDSFVFSPLNPPLDDNLTVGGAPSARSLIRVAMPEFLRDSFDIVRATLILVPVGPVPGAAGDSFAILARPILTDLGGKSPLSIRSGLFGGVTAKIGTADTVRLELTNMVRNWTLDTSAATGFVLGQVPEGASYTEIRFYSSRTPAFRPALQVTYVKRFPFGEP